jgi:hypothetical protein
VNITDSGTCSSGNTGIATVGGGTGLATYVAPGSTTLTSNISFFRDTGLGECLLYRDVDNPPVTVNPTVTIDSFSPNPIAQNSSASVLVTVQPSTTITLTITSSGTGRATFGSSGSTTTQISGTTSVSIRGDATSTSGAVDLTLTAKYGTTPLATKGFSVTSGACTAVPTGTGGEGLKTCPTQVQLSNSFSMTNYCSTCQISCLPFSYDSTFTPGSCEASTSGIPGSGNRTLTSTETGNFTSTDCDWHYVQIRTVIINAQGTTTTNYNGFPIGLRCTTWPNGTSCP